MSQGNHYPIRRVAGIGLILMTGLTAGCEFGRDFRAAALPAVHQGADLVLTGLLDGLFAAMEPEAQTEQ